MYQLFVEEHFDAAHLIRDYNGKCENTHGNRFKVIVRLEAEKLQQNGLAYDFALIKRSLREALTRYDHAFLNEISPFDRIEPSCENIAATLYDELLPNFIGLPVILTSVEVWESPTTGVSYKR
jgi:6-pyruvoyltetrahydropterin/6-carboxytetrahydropterin synthase